MLLFGMVWGVAGGGAMSRPVAVEWREGEEELYGLYKGEGDLGRRKRLQALWLVRRGLAPGDAGREAGVGLRTLERWLEWYRDGGLDGVLRRVPGHGAPGSECRLTAEQLGVIVAKCSAGEFRTTPEVRDWVEREWGVSYRYGGMYGVLARLDIHPKLPRPVAAKADPEAQEAFKKGGLPTP